MPPSEPLPLSFWDRHPILTQIYTDASELSKQQIILPSVMTAATFFASLISGETISPWLVIRSTGLSLIVGLGLYLLIAVLRAPFIVIGRHHRQLLNLNQNVAEISVSQPSTEPIWKPVVERDGARIIWQTMKSDGVMHEVVKNLTAGQTNVNVVLARLHHKMGERGRAAYVDIKAHVYVCDVSGSLITDYDAIWWLHEESKTLRLAVGDRADLVLCVFAPAIQELIFSYGHHAITDGFETNQTLPIMRPRIGKVFQIDVELTLSLGNRVFDQLRFGYRLNREHGNTLIEN